MRKPFDPPSSASDYPLSRWAMRNPLQCGLASASVFSVWASFLWANGVVSALSFVFMFAIQYGLWRPGGYLSRRTGKLFSEFERDRCT